MGLIEEPEEEKQSLPFENRSDASNKGPYNTLFTCFSVKLVIIRLLQVEHKVMLIEGLTERYTMTLLLKRRKDVK